MSRKSGPRFSGKDVLQSKTLSQKLGIEAGLSHFVAGAPAPYDKMIGKLPAGASIVGRRSDGLGLIHIFTSEREALADRLARCRDAIKADGMIWISWPKKASRLPTRPG